MAQASVVRLWIGKELFEVWPMTLFLARGNLCGNFPDHEADLELVGP